MKKILFIINLFFFTSFSWSQISEISSELEDDKSSIENTILIDSLLKVSQFEEIFNEYCLSKIEREGKKKKMTTTEIENIKSKINFEKFKKQTLYNAFSGYTSEELKSSIQFINTMNKNHQNISPNFICSFQIINNLELFVDWNYLNER